MSQKKAKIQIVIADPQNNRTFQSEITGEYMPRLIGKKIGDIIEAREIGYPEGYQFKITGGSDEDGFPMRNDIEGPAKKRILFSMQTVGYRQKRRGVKRRKTVRGNMISEETGQINVKITKYGKKVIGPSIPEAEKKPKSK